MATATSFVAVVSDSNSPQAGISQVVDPLGGARVNLRPLDYQTPNQGNVLGHYRAVAFSGAAASIGAAGIIGSLRWNDSSRFFVLTRLAMNVEVLTAITTAVVLDAQCFVFRGATGNAAGAGSTTLSMVSPNQKCRGSMGVSLFSNAGEIRTLGTTTALTAATGKTNDAAPFGAAFWGSLFNTSATGIAVLVSPGAAITPGGWQDLYSLNSLYQHPIVLVNNEGIETQVITANNTTGTIKYGFLYEWAEVAAF